MKKWLIVYESGSQEIVNAEDFIELHRKVDNDIVSAIIRLYDGIPEEDDE